MDRNSNPQGRSFGRRIRGIGARRESGSSSLARAVSRLGFHVLFAFSLMAAFMVQPAFAATWPVSTSGLSTTLGFHQSYTAGIKSYVHSGIDIPASAGMQISSPLAGTVRFTGTVPSGDSRTGGASSQPTMNAVSIEVQDGRVVTLMPFDSIQVSEGQSVCEGQCLGTLAASGDISTPGAHVHMGYKEGSTYLDPMQLFGLASPSGGASQKGPFAATLGESAAPVATQGAGALFALQDGAAASLQGEAGSLSPAQNEAIEAGNLEGSCNAAQVQAPSFGTISTGDYELASSCEEPAGIFEPVALAAEGLMSACRAQAAALVEALSSLAALIHIPLAALCAALVLVAMALLAVPLVLLARRYGTSLRKGLGALRANAGQLASNAKTLLVPGWGR